MKPDKNQTNCYDKLSRLKVGALFMDAGAGKTLPAMNLIKSSGVDYVLWLTPFQTKQNLRDEINKQGGLECDILGIESLQNSDRIYLEARNKLTKNSFIVCDESIKIKNSDANRTQRILNLAILSTYRLILNGTPITRNLLDLWSQMEFLSPKILSMGKAEFKNTFCEYTTMTKNVGHGKIVREWINKYHNLDYLYSLIKPYVFECGYEIEAEIQYINVNYTLCDESESEYQMLKTKYLDNEVMEAMNNNIFLELTQKMQHCYSCTEDKLNVLKKIVSDNPDSKILVVRKFIDSGEFIESEIDSVKVISYGKHAYGLNLQEYEIMVIWDKTWDYGAMYQIIKRIHRKGQNKDVRIFQMHENVPLGSLMSKNIDKKGKLLHEFKQKTLIEIKKVL